MTLCQVRELSKVEEQNLVLDMLRMWSWMRTGLIWSADYTSEDSFLSLFCCQYFKTHTWLVFIHILNIK